MPTFSASDPRAHFDGQFDDASEHCTTVRHGARSKAHIGSVKFRHFDPSEVPWFANLGGGAGLGGDTKCSRSRTAQSSEPATVAPFMAQTTKIDIAKTEAASDGTTRSTTP
jgi:hypothetical protein